MTDRTDALLQALLTTLGRATFSPDQIHAVVNPKGNAAKQVKAYNLADGTRTQADIAKSLKLDTSNFSKSVKRWVESGVLFKLTDGLLLHVYPVPEKLPGQSRV